MWRDAMKEMCADCPFGRKPKQLHMRSSLRPGRFDEICQSVWQGAYFPCHKTTHFDDDGEHEPSATEKMCRGALEFVERAAKAREQRERPMTATLRRDRRNDARHAELFDLRPADESQPVFLRKVSSDARYYGLRVPAVRSSNRWAL